MFSFQDQIMQKQFTILSLGVLLMGSFGCQVWAKNLSVKPTPVTVAAAPSPTHSALEQSVHTQINKYRQSKGLAPLTLNATISDQARAHSQAMAQGKVPFSHQGFETRVRVISQKVPYRGAAENVAFNKGYSDPATQAVQGWLKSPGHLKNIQGGQYNLTGVGVVKNAKGEYYLTQIFIQRR